MVPLYPNTSHTCCLIILALFIFHLGDFASTSETTESTLTVSSETTENTTTTTENSTPSVSVSSTSSTANLEPPLERLDEASTNVTISTLPPSTESFSSTESSGCTCGVSAMEKDEIGMRIIGGSLAMPHSYPWQAILRYYKRHVCSATVINDRYVLTAAHCIFMIRDFQRKVEIKYGRGKNHPPGSINMEQMTVVLGAHDSSDETNTEVVSVVNFLIHPKHRVDAVHDINDIALVRLGQRIQYTTNIQPVCLPKQGEDFSGKMGVIVGWGHTQFNGTNSQYLKHAKVHILADSLCLRSRIGSHFAESPESMICAYEYRNDACQGDSGGPLLYKDASGSFIQPGIISWGIECAQVGYPGVYTQVSTFTDWIKVNTRDAVFCSKS